MKMKKLLALLLCVCVLGGLVACGGDTDAVDGSGAGENAGTEADNTEVDLPVSGKTMQDFVAEYDNICTATYVDSYFGFTIDYPTFTDVLNEEDTYWDDEATMIIKSDAYDSISTILSTKQYDAFKIYYPWIPEKDTEDENKDALLYSNAKDFYENYFKNNSNKSLILIDNYYDTVTNEKHLNSYTFGELTWEEYEFSFESCNHNVRAYFTVKDNIPFIFIFRLFELNEEYPCLKEQWPEIIENRDSIMLSIVSSLDFSVDKETMLNTKEISVCYHHYDSRDYGFAWEENLTDEYESITFPLYHTNNYRSAEDIECYFYKMEDDIPIDNVLETIFSSHGYILEKINSTEDSYIITNKEIGDYEVKYYDVNMRFSEDSTYTFNYGIYVFKTDTTYGWLLTSIPTYYNYRSYINQFNFAIKNLKFTKKDESRRWEMTDYIYD